MVGQFWEWMARSLGMRPSDATTEIALRKRSGLKCVRKPKPTIEELDAILNGQEQPPCVVQPDGTVAQPFLIDILTALVDEGGAIVSSAACSPMELAFAKKEGRFYVDADGFGYVLRLRMWRELAESKLAEMV